ncbi:MAG: S8 family serine peptidase [Xanthomonadales bacterium]|nr:S8 family serine peptidase [Xanthomonadales bacterium]
MIRQTTLAAAIALGMGLVAAGQPNAQASSFASTAAAEEQATYLVYFEEPAVASFRGFDAAGMTPTSKAAMALQATSPAVTGARHLDVKSAASVAYRDYLAEQRSARLLQGSKRIGRELKPSFVYDLASNGVALTLNQREAALLRGIPGVKRVVRDFVRKPQTDAGPRWIHADAIWGGDPDIANEGEGVVIGVIDTGIEATHPAFAATGPVDGYVHQNPRGTRLGKCSGGGGGCNDKLIGIYDFTTGTDDNETNDGSDQVGHGTHVSSTAAGNHLDHSVSTVSGDVLRHLSGVAPHANLIMYKACEDESSCQGSWLMAALDQAVADQVDVINYSIGGGTNNPWTDGDALAFLGARQAGIVPVSSAGNDGPGPSTVSSPANAPWMLSVANVSHNRVFGNRLVEMTGGDTAPPDGGVLFGVGATVGYGPADIVYAGDYGNALCATGPNTDALPPDESTNPWPTGASEKPFNGEIVVCDRGLYARVIKGFNVGLAGGGGFVLANSSADGESIVRDSHKIPGTHIGFFEGQKLKQWLASGTGHRARIEGETLTENDAYGDILNQSSSRGLGFWGSFLTPNISAPGTNILAAVPGGGFAYYTGTSMASPHVAGAAALLIAAHPAWTPTQVMSALLTTARPSVKIDLDTPATPLEQGNGTVDLARAVNAGLYFPIERSDFDAAKTGDTRDMNLPALVDEDCFLECTLTRTVKDMAGGGTWTAVWEMPDGAMASVSPSTFTLADGQSTELSFAFDVRDANVSGDWVFGHLHLERTGNDGVPDVEIPVAIKSQAGDLPTSIDIETDSESGFVDIDMSGLIALPEAQFASSVLNDEYRVEQRLKRGNTRDTYEGPFDEDLLRLVTVPASDVERLFSADLESEDTAFAELYLGFDANADGLPSQNEELCSSSSTASSKHCEYRLPSLASDLTLWVLVRNGTAGSAVARDDVDLSYRVLDSSRSNGLDLVASGPGHVAQGDDFQVRISWNAPDILPGHSKLGYLLLGAKAGREGKTGKVPVTITRTGAVDAPAALVSGRTRVMKLAPGDAQERLFIDVPPNASRLQIESSGEGEVDLYAAWGGNFPAARTDTSISPAPSRGDADGTSIHGGATESIDLQGASLKPGRWYITPVNGGDADASFSLTATVTSGSQAAPAPQFGGYYNPARSGSGAFLYRVAGSWALILYSFLDDGTPTWYLGTAPQPSGTTGTWTVSLGRFAWDGDSASARQVGEATVTMLDETSMAFTTTIDGEVASQRMVRVDPGTCPVDSGNPLELTASWYAPTLSGAGFSVTAIPELEATAAYFYDEEGRARWAIGSSSPFGTDTLPMSVHIGGSCFACSYEAAQASAVGSYVRTYAGDGSSGHAKLDLALPSPLSGEWHSDADIVPLTEFPGCQ